MITVYIADRAIVVEGGQILAVLRNAEARSAYAGAKFVEFSGCVFTPGLIDSHIHLIEWAVARAQVDLAHANSIDEAAAQAGQGRRTRDWLLGRGWNPHRWGGTYPDRHALDRVISDAPAVLQSHDMHALWLNTRALERIGIDEQTGDPDGGRILRDADGRATGVLLENAAQLVVPHLPRYDVDTVIPLISDAQRALHAYGITGVHSFPGVHLKEPDPLTTLQLMRERSQLTLRILQHIALEQLDAAIRAGLHTGAGDQWIRIGGVKMFLDGALGSRTAWMQAPYEGSDDRGVQVMRESDFREAVGRAARNGISSVVHAIGDAAVALAFDVLTDESVQVHAAQHRVEHVQCLPQQFGHRLNKGVLCSVQPSHLMSDWRAADRHWGRRSPNAYAFRTMLHEGAPLAFGSDAPVEPADPRHGLYAAVTRMDLNGQPDGGWYSEQSLTIEEALNAYTGGASLRPGALADFVAWKQDPLVVAPATLLSLEAGATIVGGQIVYEG